MDLPECEFGVPADQQAYKTELWLRIGGPVAILLLAVVMAIATWGKWPDVLIDFGRELYIPWRITEGDRLYKDIAYHNGPLSPHVNALWFTLFGVSLRTLIVANLVILALIVILIYSLFLKIGGYLAATLAGLIVVLLFAFNQYVFTGNYNYVCPYSHETTHGLVLSLAAIWCFQRYLNTMNLRWVITIGCLTGLTFLTKPEVFLALAAAVAMGLVLVTLIRRFTARRIAVLLSVMTSGFLAPILTAIVFQSFYMPVAYAARYAMGAWSIVLAGEMARQTEYQAWMGLDDPKRSLLLLSLSSAAYVIWLILTMGTSMLITRWRQGPDLRTRLIRLIPLALVVLITDLLLAIARARWWNHAFRPLPLVLALLGVTTLVGLFRTHDNWEACKILLLRLTIIVFAQALLLKIILNTRIYHYGFALAMPGTLLLGTAFVVWLPEWLRRGCDYKQAFRASAINVCLIVAIVFLILSFKNYTKKTYIVGKGPDAIRTDWRGRYVNDALSEISKRLGPDDTLSVVPEGIMLNFLTWRVNSTPYSDLLPFWFLVYSEQDISNRFMQSAPEWILVVNRDCGEFGYGPFGIGYAKELWRWIEQNYEIVDQIGEVPSQSDAFGMVLFKRKQGA